MPECSAFVEWFIEIEWLEIFKVATQLLVGLGWPMALVFLGWLFRREIQRKFQEIETAGPTGVTFRRQEQRAALDLERLLLDAENHRPAVRALEEPILRDLAKLKEAEHVSVLVNQLVIARLGRQFEQIYSIIFGSQIDGLKRLNSAGGSVSLAEAEQFFAGIKSRESGFYGEITFAQWFQYISTTGLAHVDEGRVIITELGREFLIFIDGAKKGASRPY